MSDVVQTLWGFCHTLRHEGIDYGDYIEQLTYLLFLKMADERGIELPKDCDWRSLVTQSGTDLRDDYIDVLRKLGKQRGLLGDIFAGAQSRFNNPVNLKKLLGVIDETEWTALDIDVKAAAFEGLLERAASEGKKGAGQYFTPRILIKAIVRCMKPDPRTHPEFTICDPACGTGGFLVASYEWLIQQTKGAVERDLAKRLKSKTFFGQELVQRPRRLTLMNLYLHGLEPHIALGDSIYDIPSGQRFDLVMTNPPFGTRGANQAPTRDDFTISTSNKQLNFIQHVMTILKAGGRAAVVVPDNCLFDDEAGEVFKILTEDCSLHTVLRLPNGTFTPYSPTTKTNVVFFTKGYKTDTVWVYDERSNVPHITKKDRPLTADYFVDFVNCFGNDPNGRAKRRADDSKTGRWRCYSIDELKERAYKIDRLTWLKDETADANDELLEPQDLAADSMAELQATIEQLKSLTKLLNDCDEVVSGHITDGRAPAELIEASPKLEQLPEESDIPDGWSFSTIGKLISGIEAGKNIRCLERPPRAAEKGIVKISAVTWGEFQENESKTLENPTLFMPERTIRAGDLLISRANTIDLVGACVLVKDIKKKLMLSDKVLRLVAPDEWKPWILMCLRSRLGRHQIENMATGNQLSMRNITQESIRSIIIPIPSIQERDEILGLVDRSLELTDAVKHNLRLAVSVADKLPQAIVAKALRGEVVGKSRKASAHV